MVNFSILSVNINKSVVLLCPLPGFKVAEAMHLSPLNFFCVNCVECLY